MTHTPANPESAPRVMLLCGGLGMRLREESEHKPKTMVEIGGRPLIWHLMRHYARFGLKRFVVCLGYKGERIREYFLNYDYMNHDFTITLRGQTPTIEVHAHVTPEPGHDAETEHGWEVTLAETGQTAMTGARVRRAARYIDTDLFLCTYGDGVGNVNIKALLQFHRAHGRIATVTSVSPQSRFGALVTDGDRVLEFAEKPELEGSLVNGGFFVFDKRVLDYLSDEDDCILEREPFMRLAGDRQMMTFRHTGYWHCMDTPRDVQQLSQEWHSGRPGWLQPPPA